LRKEVNLTSLNDFIPIIAIAFTRVKRNSNAHYKSQFFEIPPLAGFQKTDFGVASGKGIENTKIRALLSIK